jgi:hypothetical protein
VNLLIRDRSAYEHLNPLDVARYLTSVGWKEVEHQPDRLSVWSWNHGSDALEVLLPLRRTLGDFVLRMADVVNSIAAIENRSPVEVIIDLQTSGRDVEIRGFVVQLRSEDVANPVSGPVIVKGYVDGISRRVQITLDTQEHQQAAMAYRDRLEVSCRGELTKQGNSWVLTHPRQFTAIQDE